MHKFYGQNAEPQTVTRAWAVKMHNGHVRRAASCGNLAPQTLGARFVRACVAQMRMDMWEESYLSRNLQENAAPATQVLCSCNAHGQDAKAFFCTNLREKCCASDFYTKCTWTCEKSRFTSEFRGKNAAPQMLGACFARACAIEMHMDM